MTNLTEAVRRLYDRITISWLSRDLFSPDTSASPKTTDEPAALSNTGSAANDINPINKEF